MSTQTKEKAELFDVPTTVKVSAKGLEDIIVTAIEGGFGISWFPVWRLRDGDLTEADDKSFEARLVRVCKKAGLPETDTISGPYNEERDRAWNGYLAWNVAQGGTLTVFEDEQEDGKYKPHTLTREKLLTGLAMVLQKFPHLASVMGEDEHGGTEWDMDAIGADAVIQCALLGDLVYG